MQANAHMSLVCHDYPKFGKYAIIFGHTVIISV